jgi:hypothetical protein
LTDNLVKALREKFLTDRANSALTSLPFHQLLIKSLSKTGNIYSRGFLVTDVFDEVL